MHARRKTPFPHMCNSINAPLFSYVEVAPLSLFNIFVLFCTLALHIYMRCVRIRRSTEHRGKWIHDAEKKRAAPSLSQSDAMVNKYLDGRAMHFILIRSCAARLLPERRCSRMNQAHDWCLSDCLTIIIMQQLVSLAAKGIAETLFYNKRGREMISACRNNNRRSTVLFPQIWF